MLSLNEMNRESKQVRNVIEGNTASVKKMTTTASKPPPDVVIARFCILFFVSSSKKVKKNSALSTIALGIEIIKIVKEKKRKKNCQ